MFESLKKWFMASSGPPHPLVELIEMQEQWNDARTRVPVECSSCVFFLDAEHANAQHACRRYPEHLSVKRNHWCGEYRVSDAVVRAQIPTTELAP